MGGGRTAPASEFDAEFVALTGLGEDASPFPWQRALFQKFLMRDFPPSCDIPTGLGKTSVIGIWLLALAHSMQGGAFDGYPRRLVFVVNRRTVVDQATREVEDYRRALTSRTELQPVSAALRHVASAAAGAPIAVSTLRGEFADNAEWRTDPTRPAVIIGTVDMIGSRLLFAGYGCGFKSRPLHAGLLGQDVLLVHDEAHLEPAFQQLIGSIREEQSKRDLRPLRVMALTATTRSVDAAFSLTKADLDDPAVTKRFRAEKWVAFSFTDGRNVGEEIASVALFHRDSGKAVLIYVRELEQLGRTVEALREAGVPRDAIQILTGTLRGLERDALSRSDPVFARFMAKSDPGLERRTGTVYLVCTSAGEVGIDMSADHLVCDLVPFDSMVQRLGRVNRFGQGTALVDVVEAPAGSSDPDLRRTKPLELLGRASERTGSLLRRLPVGENGRHDASPAALAELPPDDRRDAFTPVPRILPASDLLFDAWALTSIRRSFVGRPPVAGWLHGIAEWQPPDTYVAWRAEVEIIGPRLQIFYDPADLLEDFPLKPVETLRDRSDRVFDHLRKIATRQPSAPAWLIQDDGSVELGVLGDLVGIGQSNTRLRALESKFHDRTVVLPPFVGGLEGGRLNGDAPFGERGSYDVSDQWLGEDREPRRARTWDDESTPSGMRLVRVIDTQMGLEEQPQEEGPRIWRWYVRPRSADDDGSRTGAAPQSLDLHLSRAEAAAAAITERLHLGASERAAIRFAARWHDRGKHRAVWQRSIGNRDYPQQVLAKSSDSTRTLDVEGYRHEFGSLLDVATLPEFHVLSAEAQDLALHIIAAHHGRARPHFPGDEAFDPDHNAEEATDLAGEVPRRFARLERRYGRWGLAYLESLVRTADALASLPERVGSGA